MAEQEETEETKGAFNFWELIELLESIHNQEVEELKEQSEEREKELESEILKLKMEIKKNEKAITDAEERAKFWFQMNETTTKVVEIVQSRSIGKCVQVKDSFLEKGHRKRGRMKNLNTQANKMERQVNQVNLVKKTMPNQRNPMMKMNLMNQPMISQRNPRPIHLKQKM